MTKKDVPIERLKDYVGEEIAVTDWFEIDQERVNEFAKCTEDRQWIHTDRERPRPAHSGGPSPTASCCCLLFRLFLRKA